MSKRHLLISALIGMAVVSAFAVFVAFKGTLPVRERGQLAAAIHNTATNTGAAQDRIDNTNTDHAATLSDTGVFWWTQDGHQYYTPIASSVTVQQLFDKEGPFTNYKTDVGQSAGTVIVQLVQVLIPVLLLVLLWRFLRKGGAPGMGLRKSRAKEVNAEMTGVTFADFAGGDEARLELSEIVEILKHPERFEALGARTPKGVILSGPPGTGKTLLARAVAGEASVPFISASGSEFVEMFVGVGASRVRDLFEQARERSPAIIFIDEIDALGKRRSQVAGHGNEEREQTLNQLLVEMDGIDTSSRVIVIAATNRADVLDPALLRPGRFDRQVMVDLPDIIGRKQILEVHGRNKPFATDVDLAVVAKQTPGFSGADLANVVNEAAILAARHEHTVITMSDVEGACMRVMAGPERANSLLSPEERRVVAYHEMGHALVGHVLTHADPVHKVSIVSRGRALGWTMQLPDRDHVLSSRNQLTDRLAGLLGGRMAEEIVFGVDEITSGAADDIEKATRIAMQMVMQLGMSPLGLRAFLPGEPGEPRYWSEEMASSVDLEIERLLEEAYERARTVLTDRRAALDALAARLLEVETVDADELNEIASRFPSRQVPQATVVSLPSRTRGDGSDRVRIVQGSRGNAITVKELKPVALPRASGMMNFRRTSMAFLRLFRDIPADS